MHRSDYLAAALQIHDKVSQVYPTLTYSPSNSKQEILEEIVCTALELEPTEEILELIEDEFKNRNENIDW